MHVVQFGALRNGLPIVDCESRNKKCESYDTEIMENLEMSINSLLWISYNPQVYTDERNETSYEVSLFLYSL